MDKCIFCGIASGEIEADIVAASDEWLAFRDLNPTAPSHVLVIPRRHIQNMNDLSELDVELLGELLLACQKVAQDEGVTDFTQEATPFHAPLEHESGDGR